MPRMAALKKTCGDVLGRLTTKGCVGLIVVLPSDNSVKLVQLKSETPEKIQPAAFYIAAAAPSSIAESSNALCLDNVVMRAARDFQLRIFDVKSTGLADLESHGVRSITATSLPLVGSTFYATAYFMFRTLEPFAVEQTLRDVAYETLAVWAAMRAANRDDMASLNLDQLTVNVLGMAQAGFTSKEIAEQVGISSRIIDKKIDKFVKSIGAPNRLDAIQKANLFGIL